MEKGECDSFRLIMRKTSIFYLFFILLSPILASNPVSADDIIDEVNLSIPISCSLSGTGMNSHTASIDNNEHNSAIGTTTLTAFCNDNEGFAIYAVGFTDDEYGKNVLTSSALGSDYDIQTGTATSGNTSTWAMKLAILSDTNDTTNNPLTIDSAPNTSGGSNVSFSNLHYVPTEYVKVAHKNAATNMDSISGGAKLTTTYQAYVSPTQAAGTYVGQVKYTLVHPANSLPSHPETTESGKICYYSNGSNVVGTMGCQDVSSSVTLLASNFSRQGYGFAGWNTSYDYTGTFYGPQETITLTTADYSSPNNGLSLYAVWVESQGSLQDSTKVAQLCGTGQGSLTQVPTNGTANLNSVSALTDLRDNETYAIAKLADGNCWMIENLRLESTAAHNSDGVLAQGYHSSFAGLATAESANFSNSTTANSLYSIDGSTAKIIDSTGGNLGTRFPRYNNWNHQALSINRPQNPTTNSATNNTTSANIYSYGNYYTWHAAIADTTFYDSGDRDATSLCPTGWGLPIGAKSIADRSFGALSAALGGPADGALANSSSTPTGAVMSNRFRSYPNNFLYSGYFSVSTASGIGSSGVYWSSKAFNENYSFDLFLGGSTVYPGMGGINKYEGGNIRCISSN